MSATEQKNITQPFIESCFTFGILPTILTGAFDDFELNTGNAPFEGIGSTPNLGRRLRGAQDPIAEARLILPVLRDAGPCTRVSPLLLRLATDSRLYSGNQAVCRFVESLLVHRWGIHVGETQAYKHARKHTADIASLLAPGSYASAERTRRNINRLRHKGEASYYRSSADIFDYLGKGVRSSKHNSAIRSWCSKAREATGLKTRYRTNALAISDFRKFDPRSIHAHPPAPGLSQKWFSVRQNGGFEIKVYSYGNTFIIRIVHRGTKYRPSSLFPQGQDYPKAYEGPKRNAYHQNETYILSKRDLDDAQFLLQACSQVRLYYNRRFHDCTSAEMRLKLKRLQEDFWQLYTHVMRHCGYNWKYRNKLGVYFDVLQWRYLAWRSGDIFYNHSVIMKQKIANKDLTTFPAQDMLLVQLKGIPMDVAVDMLGIYKASIYPEVDPFDVVCKQRELHYSRFQTDWQPGSPEHTRFEETRAYMWYIGARVIYNRKRTWPGKIREGVEHKDWHDRYKRFGIPPENWREAQDVDLTRAIPVADISNEQYLRQQDSACAPPLPTEYKDFEAMKKAPRQHKRKLLYAISEDHLPDLPECMEKLNLLGKELPVGYTGPLDPEFDFSTDIVTGSRCERHKDAPRPFYAASSPWGCILSYFDGITRDFLNHVPQSMLGKSTKQKFTDLQTTSRTHVEATRTFYMSDDKAKYSPRMDPQSQQLPAEFFAELFGIEGMKAFGPVMYHCELYYRVCGHLVHYNSNGTDREGMRGASNTWLEIVAQGLTTRLTRERKLIKGKSIFLSFIDDGLRKFSVEQRTPTQALENARKVIDDVIFGLKVLGRELSWDKTFISETLFVMLNEIIYDGSHFSSGLKSFCTAGDVEVKEVMSAADYEQVYFGKMRGSHGVGTPLDLCHYSYIFETLMSHYTMGVRLQNNHYCNNIDYRLFCITPIALGGGGIRGMLQMGCNEVANATKEGIGNLMRMGNDRKLLMLSVYHIIHQPMEQANPVDFMREPEQCHVAGPRIKTQRLAAEVRKNLPNAARNELSRKYVQLDQEGMRVLEAMGRTLMAIGEVSAEEIRLLYSTTPVAFVDELIQKLASSTTLAGLMEKSKISILRKLVRRDLYSAICYFRIRCKSEQLTSLIGDDPKLRALLPDLIG